MALKTREELEDRFKSESRPSEQDFADLICSMLNKRDDQFHGRWQAGTTYRTGDVVIYNRALWELKADEDGNDQEICAEDPPAEGKYWQTLIVPVEDDDWFMVVPEEGEEGLSYLYANPAFERVGVGTDAPRATLEVVDADQGLFLLAPGAAEALVFSLVNLQETEEKTYLVTAVSDEQVVWNSDVPGGFAFRHGLVCEPGEEDQIDPEAGHLLVVIQPDSEGQVRVGVGTATPDAMLDVTDTRKGQFLLNPEDKADPAFTIVNLDPGSDKNYLATGVGARRAVFVSDAPRGFVFKRGADYGTYCSEANINQGQALLVLFANKKEQPRMGLGTETPQAMLDITDGKKGQFLLSPEGKWDPAFTIVNLDPEAAQNYLTTGVGKHRAVLVSDAPFGFSFNKGEEYGTQRSEANINQGEALVVFRANGRVGIGTEKPYTRLEVTNGESGRFLFNLDRKVNPALGIVNLRPGTRENYLTAGVDNDAAILVTDSDFGFVFKHGGPAGADDHEVDINQGRTLVSILPPGKDKGKSKVGIGMQPEDYQLDADGLIRAYNLFLNTDESKLDKVKALKDSVMDKLKALRPVTFHWAESTGLADEGEQIGLVAHQVYDYFPQVVKTNSRDMTRAVAYQNLVPVLVKAIQLQQDQLDAQQATLLDLLKRVEQLEAAGPTEEETPDTY